MDSSHNPAIIGLWWDHSTGEQLLSVKNPWGIVIIALAGIWLSWSTKYIKKLAGNIALWFNLEWPKITFWWDRPRSQRSEQADVAGTPTENTALLAHNPQPATSKDTRPALKIYKEKSGIRDLFYEVCFGKTGDSLWLLLFTLIIVLLASTVIVGGYFLTQIRVDGAARLASDKCGLWLFEGDKRSEAATRARMLDLEKEERAAQFAEDCYGNSGLASSRCKVLYRPTLPVSKAIYTNDCPFAPNICYMNQTVTFETELTDAKALGINSPKTPKFRRTTSCTPLSMGDDYIRNTTVNNITTYTYHYGNKTEGGRFIDYTYSTEGDPWTRLAPVYDLFSYSSNADQSDNPVWTPHADLTPPPDRSDSTVTIIFISSLRILYEGQSDDPIFPAHTEWPLPGDRKKWYYNSDPKARPLACINTIKVCTPDEALCWNVNSNLKFPDDTPEFELLYSSLYKTDIYYSLAKRQGRSLLAQKKVSQYFSPALGDYHWGVEVENWVRTALARTSINTWSVASGEDAVHEGKGGFAKTSNKHNLCGRYKYNPRDYQSIRFAYLLLVILWLPVIWILTWEGKPIRKLLKTPSDFYTRHSKTALRKLDSWGSHLRRRDDEGATNNRILSTGVLQNTLVYDEEHAVHRQAASSDGESSRRPATEQQSESLNQDRGAALRDASATHDPEAAPNEEEIEYDTIFVWQLLYCLLALLFDLFLLLGLLLAIPVSYILGIFLRARRRSAQRRGVARSPASS